MNGQFLSVDCLSPSDKLRLLSVRIMKEKNDEREVLGSGLLYIIHGHDKAYVLTAAHIMDNVADGDIILVECQCDKGDETNPIEDKYLFEVDCSKVIVHGEYKNGNDSTINEDKQRAFDAAIIPLKLDERKLSWLSKREEVLFPPDKIELKDQYVTGFGYPEYKQDSIEKEDGTYRVRAIYDACVEVKPDKAYCSSYPDGVHITTWKLELDVTDHESKEEEGGWSGSILVFRDRLPFVLAGIVLERFPGGKGRETLGADMYNLRELLAGRLKEDHLEVRIADCSVKQPQLQPKANKTEEAPAEKPAMPPVSDFNLRCVRNMLEGAPAGQSWAHKLRESKGLNVSFKQEVGQPMRLDGFEDDAEFLKAILPEKIYKILFDRGEDAASVAAVMDGTYPAEKKRKIKECLPCGHRTPIDAIINKCDKLMDAGDWERCFVASHLAFFSLMGDAARYLRYQMIQCETHENMKIGMAMFTVYALLGDAYYKAMTNKQSVTEIFRCMKS